MTRCEKFYPEAVSRDLINVIIDYSCPFIIMYRYCSASSKEWCDTEVPINEATVIGKRYIRSMVYDICLSTNDFMDNIDYFDFESFALFQSKKMFSNSFHPLNIPDRNWSNIYFSNGIVSCLLTPPYVRKTQILIFGSSNDPRITNLKKLNIATDDF
ncbi:MAG: hypothetical protein SFY68_12765 [Candidatus Sumerlaeia bacterium]|nr:hypothetical protein [Candidatus Sumerlaeia bacterium]